MFEILTDSSNLASRINADLLRARKADVAVGQLFVPDLSALTGNPATRQKVRLLIGTNAERHDAAHALQNAARTDSARSALEAQQLAGRGEISRRIAQLAETVRRSIARMAQTDNDARLLARLVELLASGAWETRAFVREPLPADLLLTDWEGRGAVLQGMGGVCPLFSASALPEGHAGFWQRSDDEVYRAAMQAQFERWWSDGVPFQTPLARELTHNWANYLAPPYLVYLLVLTRLVADRITDGDEPGADAQAQADAGLPPLADFQQVAVQQALSILRQYNGVFVADVVGLGKTYIGTDLLKRLALQGQRAVIFCPPALVPMWSEFNAVYGLAAEVVSTGKLLKQNGEDLNQPKYQTTDRQVVLIDESHRFRNQGTDAYEIISRYTRGRKCILLTATPYSLRADDVYHQIRLFADDDLDLNLSPPRLSDYFRAVRKNEASLVDVLRPLLIRRTRRHIRQHYPEAALRVAKVDGSGWEMRKITFPTRQAPNVVRYDVEGVYGGPLYERILQKLGRPAEEAMSEAEANGDMTYARYGLFRYVLPAFRSQEPYRDLRKIGANVRGFIRVLLFKRLESSVEAFRQTVHVLQTVHDRFLTALDAGMIPAGDAAQAVLQEWQNGDDDIDLVDALGALDHRYEAGAFDLARLRADVENDRDALRELSTLLAPISPDVDSKLQTLRDLLTTELRGEKALVFTQYETTARYLYENLKNLPNGVAFLSGQHRGAGGQSFMQTVARFAPKANQAFVIPNAPPLNLLIATDVLSEGLNLQDCSRIINYDLPWNPVRLIQRAGRVDRVGSEAETIALYNFLPERGVERVLHLEEVLKERIREIQEFIGEDAAILHPDERIRETELYAAFTQPLPDDETEDDAQSGGFVDYTEWEERVRQLRRDRPDLMQAVADLPGGVRTARRQSEGGGMVACFASGDYERFVVCDQSGRVRSTRPEDVLNALECDSDEPTLDLPPGYNARVSEHLAHFEREADERRADRKMGPKLSAGQQYALKHFTPLVRGEQNPERKQRLVFVEQALRARLPDAALRELSLIRRQGLTGDGLRQRLEQAYHDLDLARYVPRAGESEGAVLSSRPGARVVCSAALL